jgi:hypothetical protein
MTKQEALRACKFLGNRFALIMILTKEADGIEGVMFMETLPLGKSKTIREGVATVPVQLYTSYLFTDSDIKSGNYIGMVGAEYTR